MAADNQCQPTAEPVRQYVALVERLRVWPAAYGEDAMSSTYVGEVMKRAADHIEELKARAEQAEQEVDVLESNAREQAKLLADTGRRVEDLETMLRRMVVEFTDHHYPGCPKEASDDAQCECFAGNLVEDARALAPSTPAVSR